MSIKKHFLALFFLFIGFLAYSQTDTVTMIDGKELRGKVVKYNPNDLQFIHQNETLEYTLNKKDISKITFSSGRIEYLNDMNASTKSSQAVGDYHNKVAILPFGYVRDQEKSNETMTKKIQQETYTIFNSKKLNLKFQDPTETNALLYKAGINETNLQGFTMGEICHILNVEYVISGLVSIEKTSTYTSNYGNSQTKVSTNNNSGKINSTGSSSSTTYQNYNSNITMNIFSINGDNLFTQSHNSFWGYENSYKTTLDYLAKRTPLYKR
jgi:hypothetical protein